MKNNGLQLEHKHEQQLLLTQSLVQSLKILQMGRFELLEFVNQMMLENPVLEEDDNSENLEIISTDDLKEKINEFEDYWNEENDLIHDAGVNNGEITNYEEYVSDEMTLHDYLIQQLRTSGLKSDVYDLVEYMIECIGSDGYLEIDDNELLERENATSELISEAKAFIKTLDPVGVGASNLRECLLWQLESAGINDGPLYEMVDKYLEDVAENKMSKISHKLQMSVAEVQKLADEIRHLEPWPASGFKGNTSIKYIIPDILLNRGADGYSMEYVSYNEPRLRISTYYSNVLTQYENDNEVKEYLSRKIAAGEALINSIAKRKQTIMSVVAAIVEIQHDFVEKGSAFTKPMRLKDVAEKVGMHESTVSRAINGKYIRTEHGIYELRKLFNTGISSGDSLASSVDIKIQIEEMIKRENSAKPLSDKDISDEFGKKGIEVSRRTVAKYREALNIPTSFKRRRYGD